MASSSMGFVAARKLFTPKSQFKKYSSDTSVGLWKK